jgi:DNA-binding FadR family transcriptional regulator
VPEPSSQPFRGISRNWSFSNKVVEQLTEGIVSGHLPPVEVNELGSENVADSMRLMVRGREGLDYGKVNEVRTALEVQTARLAAQRAKAEDIERLSDDHERSLRAGDMATAGELDFQFHRELTRASDNELLLGMLDSISDLLREVRNQAMNFPHVGEKSLQAHRRILRGAKAKSPAAARSAMANHLAEAERVWRSACGRPSSVPRKPKSKDR